MIKKAIPRVRRLGLPAAIVVAAAFALPAVPAAAHTELAKSTPAQDATVRGLAEVSLVFTENVRLAKVKVVDATGNEFQSGAARVAGDTVAQRVSGGMAAGKYTLAYRVVSADGHPVEGRVPFKVALAAPRPGDMGQVPAQARERPAASTTTTGGGQKWLMVGAGLLAGMGIGFAIVFLRRGKDAGRAGD